MKHLSQRKLRKILCLPFFMLVVSSPAIAGKFDSLTDGQMSALSPLLSAYNGGSVCDLAINTEVATQYLDSKLGKSNAFGNASFAASLYLYITQQALQTSLGALPTNKSERINFCKTMLDAFGPNGTQIKGILEK